MKRRPGPKASLQPVGDVRDPSSMWHHMQRYLAFLKERNYSPRTLATREAYLRYFIAWCFDRALTRPEQVDRPILERYQGYLFYYRKDDGNPLTVRSQQTRIMPLKHWYQWLVRQGHLLYNPASDLELPRSEKRLPRAVLSMKEAEAVLSMPDIGTPVGLRDRAILETFYSTGMRRFELIGLSIFDVDFERGTVLIRQGKGKKDRMIPIGERALAWIEKYRDETRPAFVLGKDDGTLFVSGYGVPFHPNHLTTLVRTYVAAAGLPKVGACHMFRHTMATLMLENGADIRFIQAMLGHANLSTTEVYTRVSVRKLKAIHTATHPGRLPSAQGASGIPGANLHTLEEDPEDDPMPTAANILTQLDLEAVEELGS